MKRPALPLFWRTFGLLLLLLFAGFALWSQGIALRQEYPRAQALAGQLTTAVNLTRSAIVYSKPSDRIALLAELNQDERVGVFVREENDQVLPLSESRLNAWLSQMVQDSLGKNTLLAREVNKQTGLWISFDMGGNTLGLNSYWLRVEPARMETRFQNPTRWWLWLASALIVAFAGAAWITRRLTQPLSALAQRTKALSEGAPYIALPASSVKEIATVNQGMNQMAQALADQDSERNIMLAGLSHDLRTPLSRLRLEIELSSLSPEQRQGMNSDIAQIDAQLKQFTDFISSEQADFKPIDLAQLCAQTIARYERDSRAIITHELSSPAIINADALLINRLLTNLIENACRYGHSEPIDDAAPRVAQIHIHCEPRGETIVLSVQDQGTGVDPAQLNRLTQPFVRGDSARSGADGSGLGLAIVDRIAKKHGAQLVLENSRYGGFCANVLFKLTKITL